MSLEAIKDKIQGNNNFLIATHYNPDADTIGSALALYRGLRQIDKNSLVLSIDGVPKDCRFIPGNEEIRTFALLLDSGFSAEHLIIVDCNNINRVSQEESHLSLLKRLFTMVIDHHELSVPYGDIRWIEPQTASTTMMIYRLLKELDVEITKDIAICLYAGLCIDTGNFRHDNTSSDSLKIASELIKKGISPSRIYRELFEAWSPEKFRLFKEALKGLEERGGVAIMTITRDMMVRAGCEKEDAGNFVDFPKRALHVKVSVLLKEIEPGKYRVSMRSKGEINVAVIASEHGGGGHRNAAGCTIEGEEGNIKNSLFARLLKAM